MKIVAFLQNQWFKEPERVRAIYAKHPDMREELNKRFLFAGCKTGHVLHKVFGEKTCQRIIWEEASPKVGADPKSAFPADTEHMRAVIEKHNPKIVIAFGQIASAGLFATLDLFRGCRDFYIITGPHPAARHPDALQKLRIMVYALGKYEADHVSA